MTAAKPVSPEAIAAREAMARHAAQIERDRENAQPGGKSDKGLLYADQFATRFGLVDNGPKIALRPLPLGRLVSREWIEARFVAAIRAADAMSIDWPALPRSAHPEVMLEIRKGDYPKERRSRATALPGDHDVALETWAWLTWLDDRDARLVAERAWGMSWQQMGDKRGRDPRTIQRWHDHAIGVIQTNLARH